MNNYCKSFIIFILIFNGFACDNEDGIVIPEEEEYLEAQIGDLVFNASSGMIASIEDFEFEELRKISISGFQAISDDESRTLTIELIVPKDQDLSSPKTFTEVKDCANSIGQTCGALVFFSNENKNLFTVQGTLEGSDTYVIDITFEQLELVKEGRCIGTFSSNAIVTLDVNEAPLTPIDIKKGRFNLIFN